MFATKTASSDNANFPSVEHEGKGTETVVVAAGSRAECPTVAFSDLGAYTTEPNKQHASSLTPVTNPTLASITPTTAASGSSGTQLITATGTGFKPGCEIWHNNQKQNTTYVSATSLNGDGKEEPDRRRWCRSTSSSAARR